MIWSRFMTALTTGWTVGLDTWRHGPVPQDWDVYQAMYAERWFLYTGELFDDLLRHNPYRDDPSIYRNTKLLWKHIEAVVDFYAGVIYQGSLSTDGTPLPDDVPNAIPILPQTGRDDRDQLLLVAIAELENAWNWRQQMSLRPMYGAALGDVLTEVVDDVERRFVYPQIVWPGYVKDIELDYVGNVRSYTLEYRVPARGDDSGYLYRKEVDGDAFRHYRDDKLQRTVPNPYGFVPAIWDRHRIAAPGSVRGKAAADGTRQALLHLNSLFGHALDFQHKAFWVPLMVAGRHSASSTSSVDLGTPPTGTDLSELYRWVKVPEGSTLLQPAFNLGETRGMVEDIREGILAENPEASFYQQLRDMQQVTAPGAERLMGDVKTRVDLARAGYDAQTVKLFQMAIAIAGFRSQDRSENGWAFGNARLDRRRQQFTSFDLDSYARGELDMMIESRPIVLPTEQERIETELRKIELIRAKEGIGTSWGMEEAEIPREDATKILAQRREAFSLAMNRGDFGDDFGESA